jgi:hypothetical protein
MESIPFSERISCTPKEAVAATGIRMTKLYELLALSDQKPAAIKSKKIDGKRLVIVASLREFIEGGISHADAA